MNLIKETVYQTSIGLAEEKGPFLAFDADKHIAQPFIQSLDNLIKSDIKVKGIRNAAIMTVPPVGSGSILVGSSSGIEPIFAFSYKRRSKSLSKSEFEYTHPLMSEFLNRKPRLISYAPKDIDLPAYFVEAHNISPEFRVKMQAVVQRHIDQSISSTVNLPENISMEKVEKIYFQAWEAGCKGITIYREGSREGILETDKIKKEPKMDAEGEFDRPKVMEGKTIKLKTVQGNLYLTVNSNGKPKEVFVNLGKQGSGDKADAEAIGRLISLYLQSGGTVENVIKALKGIKSGHVSWDEGVQIFSVPDAIAKALGMITIKEIPLEKTKIGGQTCPECNEETLIEEGGCRTCQSCGFSQCS
jgi:ribonucleoside-diphosphate reductase alpha chain